MNPTKTSRARILKQTRRFATAVAAGSLLAAPAIAQATTPPDKAKNKPAKTKAGCAKPTQNLPFTVTGTLVSATADNPATPASEATVTLTVTAANSHAKKSGEIADQNATKPGVQVKGATFTVPAGDAYTLKLNGYEGTDTASAGDKVKVQGKIVRTKAKCAPAGTSTADRYGAVDVRKVTISDRDPDA